MEFINLIKKNNISYMIDSLGCELDIENFSEIESYEQKNHANVKSMISNFLFKYDENFKKILDDIEKLIKKYQINDYTVYGDGLNVADENIAVIYNFKNINSQIDCCLKVFFNETSTFGDKLTYMIDFSSGSSGRYFGFELYSFFQFERFSDIKEMISIYFSSDESPINDILLINNCMENIKTHLSNHYIA